MADLKRELEKQKIQLRLLETEVKSVRQDYAELKRRYEQTLRELEPIIDFTPEILPALAQELKADPELKPIELPHASKIGIAME